MMNMNDGRGGGGYRGGGGGFRGRGGGGYRGRGGNFGGGDSGPSFKRIKRDDPNVDPTNPDPSIVVHVRNLSPKATEADLLEALSHFGPIAYATCMPNKHMALVEFEDVEGARSCVVYAQTNQIYVAGQPALFNYSTSKIIQRLGLESETPNHVLIATVFNVQYPITVEVIHQIVKSHGDCKRIAILRRQMLQALIEMDSVEGAKKVKHALNGADIYSGCCTLKVEFAKPDFVKITRNDADQCDFTIPPGQMPPQMPDNSGRKTLLGDAQGPGGPMPMQQPGGLGGPGGPMQQPGMGQMGGPMQPMNPQMPMQQMPMPNMNQMAPNPQMGAPVGPQGNYPMMGGQQQNMGYGGGNYSSQGPNYNPAGYHNNNRNGYGGGQGRNDYQDNRGGGGYGYDYQDNRGGGYGPPEVSQVVMVYGIDQNTINCEKLFNLLCLFGNCLKIKFMKSKPDTCMAQMGSVEQVQTAIEYLHGAYLFDQKLALRPSKQTLLHDIRDPFELPDGTPSFMDFTGNRNQRWDNPQSAARNRLVRPCATLHWYNAPVEMTDEQLKQIFSNAEAPIPVSVTLFPSKSERSSSGVCEFETVEQATEAMVKANHKPVDSDKSSQPYILKLAYAGGRDGRDFKH